MSTLQRIIEVIGRLIVLPLLILLIILVLPLHSYSLTEESGEALFEMNCSGCHVNGGNIIRRSKTLRIKDLKRNELDNPAAIARVARDGVGIMSGYEEVLGKGGDELVANWIWEQAQKAWIQG